MFGSSYTSLLRGRAPVVTYFDHLFGEFVSFGPDAVALTDDARHQVNDILDKAPLTADLQTGVPELAHDS